VLVIELLTVAGQKRVALGERERRQRRMLLLKSRESTTSTSTITSTTKEGQTMIVVRGLFAGSDE
jgi:hypothetical protein